jgi:hypothetical protein
MTFEEHKANSIKLFGKPFKEVHAFLDQYAIKYSDFHRKIFHHAEGVRLVVQKFGEESRRHAEQHIIDDMGYLPESWLDYKFSREGQEDDLQVLYGEDYEKIRWKYFSKNY